MQLFDIGHSPLHVFKSRLIGFIVRNQPNRRSALGHLFYQPCQLTDGDLFRVADIEHLAGGFRDVCKQDQRCYDIAYIGETARLLAAAEHRDRLSAQRLLHESR